MPEPSGKGIKLADLYEAGWEIRIDDLPIEEHIKTAFGGSVFDAYPRAKVRIARGDDIAIEWDMGRMDVDGNHVAQLVEDIEAATERRERPADR